MTEEIQAGLTPEEEADLLLLRDAATHGQPLWQYLREAGIAGEAAQRRIRRHESNNFNGLFYDEVGEADGDG